MFSTYSMFCVSVAYVVFITKICPGHEGRRSGINDATKDARVKSVNISTNCRVGKRRNPSASYMTSKMLARTSRRFLGVSFWNNELRKMLKLAKDASQASRTSLRMPTHFRHFFSINQGRQRECKDARRTPRRLTSRQ